MSELHYQETLIEAASLGKWLQAVRLPDGRKLPGQWQPELILSVLTQGIPASDWKGRRVLDIGACNGGLSIELARLGAHVHAIEPNPVAIRQYEFARRVMGEDLPIEFERGTLFTTDRRPRYDVVLFLGLVYHFRYPQLILDYLTGFDAETFFVSSQTYDSPLLLMQNRKEATPHFYGKKPGLAGYHPSRPLLKAMIEWAGFREVQELVTPETGRDFEKRRTDITNSAYFMARKGSVSNYEALKDVYM